LDTNLNLKYRASTIDTITSIDIKTGAQKQTITATTPVRVVNSKSKVSEGKLYNISKLIADNESISSFNENAVIDIYNLTNGQYEKSYYVPLYKRDKIVDFRKTGAGFIVVYKTHIATFIHPR
jgi:hypothetical protein